MSLADSLGPLIVPKRSDAQTPKRPDASTSSRVNVPTLGRLDAQAPKRPGLPLQGTAMSKHPDFVKKTLYVRGTTIRDAMRRYEDEGGKTESELVQMLLERYVVGGRG